MSKRWYHLCKQERGTEARRGQVCFFQFSKIGNMCIAYVSRSSWLEQMGIAAGEE